MAGVIATPLVHRFDISAADPEDPEADGDRFVILASDGVWEFIDSEAACGIVAAHGRSNRGAGWTAGACEALVLEAAQRWKRETSTYRDDITAIVARLPAMETGGERRRGWARVRFQLFKRQEDAQMLDVALCHRRGFKKVPPHRRPRPRSAR